MPGAPDAGEADRLKLGQIVRTLTETGNVKWVRFVVDGLEQTFAAPEDGIYQGLLNPKVVDAGKDGPPWIEIDDVKVDRTTVHFSGTADVNEAALQARLVQDGKTLVDAPVQASCGTGCRGSYVLEFAAPDGTTGEITLEVFSTSDADGSVDEIARKTITLAVKGPEVPCAGEHHGREDDRVEPARTPRVRGDGALRGRHRAVRHRGQVAAARAASAWPRRSPSSATTRST